MHADRMPDAELNDKCFREMMFFVSELKQARQLVFDSQILPDPAPVRFSEGEAEDNLRNLLGGFFVIDVASHAEAIDLARRCPHQQVGPVELHALNETEDNAYKPGQL